LDTISLITQVIDGLNLFVHSYTINIVKNACTTCCYVNNSKNDCFIKSGFPNSKSGCKDKDFLVYIPNYCEVFYELLEKNSKTILTSEQYFKTSVIAVLSCKAGAKIETYFRNAKHSGKISLKLSN